MDTNDRKRMIMRRVYGVYLARRLFSGTALRFYALVVLVAGLTRAVSVRDVIANMPEQGLLALYDFFTYATMHTELAVQFMLAGATLAALWLVRDILSAPHGLYGRT